ncbi:hypothetical protein [Methylomonas albis]|uniref:DUF86 domain-containing protein n=1 Tax=Methylomonas albis TaxID=1854563 RepID=A0ABR9D0H8_9GAMM|nr:hypothetical protein [Methylomonas albis]MBD9356622.1 hypothetical protein [Methylomonas albis]
MNKPDVNLERLLFLRRVVQKEADYLRTTDQRLFTIPFDEELAGRLTADIELAERVEAFVGRFGRLQDTLADKLLPVLLSVSGEQVGAAIDNLDRAERLDWIASTDDWLTMRRLRNQMVHEYIEDLTVLANALNSGHRFVPSLLSAAGQLLLAAQHLIERLQSSSSD